MNFEGEAWLLPVVGVCPCVDLPTAGPDDWPNCPGRLRLYPSGAVACDCGQHVERAEAAS